MNPKSLSSNEDSGERKRGKILIYTYSINNVIECKLTVFMSIES